MVVDDANIEKSVVCPEPTGPTRDVERRSFPKIIMPIVEGWAKYYKLLRIKEKIRLFFSQDGTSNDIFSNVVTTKTKNRVPCVKNKTSDRGKLKELQNFHGDLSLRPLSGTMSLTGKPYTKLTVCSWISTKNDMWSKKINSKKLYEHEQHQQYNLTTKNWQSYNHRV